MTVKKIFIQWITTRTGIRDFFSSVFIAQWAYVSCHSSVTIVDKYLVAFTLLILTAVTLPLRVSVGSGSQLIWLEPRKMPKNGNLPNALIFDME
tara:strand:+ start:238 stop:519 length:282 start_codon:yes stop_codon:yes gene_type:complete